LNEVKPIALLRRHFREAMGFAALYPSYSVNERKVGKGAQRRSHVSVNEDCESAVGTLGFAHPCHSEIDYRRHVPKGMLCRGRPSAAERLAIGSSPP
jgi:hypothetical protein